MRYGCAGVIIGTVLAAIATNPSVAQPASPPAALSSPAAASTAKTPPIDLKTRTIVVRDVSFGGLHETRISIGRIVFAGVNRSDQSVHVEHIDMEKISATFAAETIDIPSLAITSAELPPPLFDALVEGKAGVNWAELMGRMTIGRISIDRIALSQSLLGMHAVYAGLRIDGIKDGIVETARFGEMTATMHSLTKPTMEIGFHAKQLRYQQLDIAESLRYLTGGSGGKPKRLLQSAVADDIDVTGPAVTVHFDRIAVSAVDGRAPKHPFPNVAGFKPGTDPLSVDPKLRQQLIGSLEDVLRTTRIGRYSIEGIKITSATGKVSIGSIALTGLSGHGLDRFEITGLDVSVPQGSVDLDRFEFDGLDYSAMIDAALEAARTGGKPDLSPQELAKLRPHLSGLHLSKLKVDMPVAPMSLDDLQMKTSATAGNETGEISITGLKFDPTQAPPSPERDRLIALGYDKLTIDADVRGRSRTQDRTLVEDGDVSVDHAGRIHLTARLANIDIDKAMADPVAAETLIDAAQLESVELHIVDLGLAERLYAEAAKKAGVTVDAIRAKFAETYRAQAIAQFGPMLTGDSADELAKFLRSPGTLTAKLTVAAGHPPLSIGEIKRSPPPLLMQQLRLSLQASPK